MRTYLLFSVAAATLSAGCGTSSSLASGNSSDKAAGESPDASSNYGAETIKFSESSLVFVPGKSRPLGLRVTPKGAYPVRLALVGTTLDAYLDHSQVETDSEGSAGFSFTAPSSPATFAISASIGNVRAELPVSGAPGNTTLQIVPAYAGRRKIVTWVGTVSAGGACDPSAGVPAVDGDLTAEAPDKPIVTGVPLGTPLTVTVRAGHFAGGCVVLSNIVGGEAGAIGQITVPATDRPLSMGGADIPIKLGIDTTASWIAAWTTLSERMGRSFSPDEGTDAGALLNAMHDATPDALQHGFALARLTHSWDLVLARSPFRDLLGAHGLRAIAQRWIVDALPVLATNGLTGALVSPETPDGSADLHITTLGGVLPADAKFPSGMKGLSWTAAPDDHVLFGGTTTAFGPSSVAAALALRSAQRDIPAVQTVGDALSASLTCSDVAAVLTGYDGCDLTCTKKLCETAVASMWSQAANAVTTGGQLDLSASAAVSALSDTAAPSDLDGQWVGVIHLGGGPVHVGGPAVGGARAADKP
jgi:hypothetical protein